MAHNRTVVEREQNGLRSKKSEAYPDGAPELLRRNPLRRGRAAIFALAIIGVIIVCLGIFLVRPSPANRNSTSQKIKILTQISDFTPYFFSHSDTAVGFRLAPTNGIAYSDGVLFISLVGPSNETVAITEQSLPDSFAHSSGIVGDQQVTGVDGIAAIAHVDGRTTGSMISRDHRTLITLNCQSAVGSDAVMDLLRSLTPVTTGR